MNDTPTVDLIEVLRALGGEARTRQIFAAVPQLSNATTVTRLQALERRGAVTSSLTLDRLERIWTINGGKR